MQDENGRRPHPYNREDAATLVQLAHKINEQASNKVDVDEVCKLRELFVTLTMYFCQCIIVACSTGSATTFQLANNIWVLHGLCMCWRQLCLGDKAAYAVKHTCFAYISELTSCFVRQLTKHLWAVCRMCCASCHSHHQVKSVLWQPCLEVLWARRS